MSVKVVSRMVRRVDTCCSQMSGRSIDIRLVTSAPSGL